MKKYFSNKYVKINSLNSLTKAVNDSSNLEKPNKLIILTANGIYMGTLREPIDSEDYEIKNNDDMITMYRKLYLSVIDKTENSEDKDVERVSENPITITLENVEIRNNFGITKLSFVDIFIDQIIGISLGSISDN